MRTVMRTIALAIAALCLATPVSSQWLNEKTPGIPRRADGTPDLTAPAPRTADRKPDFSGVWRIPLHPGYLANVAADLDPADVQPWAAQLFSERMRRLGRDDPGTIGCQPIGPRHFTGGGLTETARIIQTPSVIAILYEDLTYRQIFMDGRKLPADSPYPSFMGYSVGRWEGDELVVESTGFNDLTWLDFGGHPHTEALRIVERYRRVNFGHVRRDVTLIDPKTFDRTITIQGEMVLAPDTDLLEYICAETARDRYTLQGAATQESVEVAPENLKKFAGVYEFSGPSPFGIRTITVLLSDGQLWASFDGKGRIPLTPLSQTMFSPRLAGTWEFIMDERGVVTHLLTRSVEGTSKAARRF